MTHYNPFPTDAEIDAIVMADMEEHRRKLVADRDAAMAAAFGAIEEQMTDANKADAARPANFNITIHGGQAAGKTTLLLFLLDALADAGVMTAHDTKRYTADPTRFLYHAYETNEATCEAVNLDLALFDLINDRIEKPSTTEGEHLIGKLTYDEALAGLMRPESFKMWIINVVSEMVDRCFDERGKMMPMRLDIEPY